MELSEIKKYLFYFKGAFCPNKKKRAIALARIVRVVDFTLFRRPAQSDTEFLTAVNVQRQGFCIQDRSGFWPSFIIFW